MSVSDSWNDSDVVNFCVAFVVYCPHFFYSMVYIISLQSKFSPGPKKKKNTRTERKLPRSRPDPFSWPRTGPIPGLSKIWPRDPSRFGVARSGPGIPDGPGAPLVFNMRWNLGKSLGYGGSSMVEGGLVKSHEFYFVLFVSVLQDIFSKLAMKMRIIISLHNQPKILRKSHVSTIV